MKNNKNLIAKITVSNAANVNHGDTVFYKIFSAIDKKEANEHAKTWFLDRYEENLLKNIEIIEPVKY